MCLDLLLPEIWTHHRTSACPFKNYQEMVEMIKLTTRQWNKEILNQKDIQTCFYNFQCEHKSHWFSKF